MSCMVIVVYIFPLFFIFENSNKRTSILQYMKWWKFGEMIFFFNSNIYMIGKKDAVAAFHLTVDDRETFFFVYNNQPAIHTKHIKQHVVRQWKGSNNNASRKKCRLNGKFLIWPWCFPLLALSMISRKWIQFSYSCRRLINNIAELLSYENEIKI